MFKRPKSLAKKTKPTKGLSPRRALMGVESFMPGHVIARPTAWRAGVVFASPHSGCLYPDNFQARSALSLAELRRNEDFFVDRLMGPCVLHGAPLLSARFPRCYVDVNRRADEIVHPDMGDNTEPSARAAAGLGVVPTHLTEHSQIYAEPLGATEIYARLNGLYHPYHAALSDLVEEAKLLFGQVLLIDCHSMPGFAPMGSRRPDIILGDRFGTSCDGASISRVRQLFEAAGYTVGTNYPYAGGFVTEHYGQPYDGVEALQIEINRDLYVNPVTQTRKRGYDRLAKDISNIIAEIIAAAEPMALAAQ